LKFRTKLTQIKIQFPTFVPMNFRKHISIVLASLVLLANLGLSFAVHYCKDEIASVSFQYQEDEPCV